LFASPVLPCSFLKLTMGAQKTTVGCARGLPLSAAKSSRRRGGRGCRTKVRRSAATSPAMAPIAAVTPLEADARLPEEARLATPPEEAIEGNAAEVVATAASEAQAAADDAKLAMLMGDEVVAAVAPVALSALPTPARSASWPSLAPIEPEEMAPAPQPLRLKRGRTWPLSVGFALEVAVHPITPYAEIYGMHPRFFDFDKGFSMVPAQGFGAARVDQSALAARGRSPGVDLSEDEEDLHSEASEDDWSDDEGCIEYLLEPQVGAQA